jgi:hypothetical protein
MSEPVVIAEWALNRRETLRVELHQFKGTDLIGIRKWFVSESGALAPGKNGINVNLKYLPQLAAAVNEALAVARANGALAPAEAE